MCSGAYGGYEVQWRTPHEDDTDVQAHTASPPHPSPPHPPNLDPSVESKSKRNQSVTGWKNKLETSRKRERRLEGDKTPPPLHPPPTPPASSSLLLLQNKQRASLWPQPAAFLFYLYRIFLEPSQKTKRQRRNGTKREREKRD